MMWIVCVSILCGLGLIGMVCGVCLMVCEGECGVCCLCCGECLCVLYCMW